MNKQSYDIDPTVAQEAYQRYKRKYEKKQNNIFFQEHHKDEWFKEKYHP